MPATKLFSTTPEGPIFSDPTDPDFTVRFKTSTAPKSLNGARTTNYVTEIIVNDNCDVVIGGVNAVDALSVRLRVSGSIESMARLVSVVNSLASQVSTWGDEDVWLGFDPTTVPVNPAEA